MKKIYFEDILVNPKAKQEAIEIFRERDAKRGTNRPSYNDPEKLLNKMIQTYLQEKEFLNIYPEFKFLGDDHDYIYDYNPESLKSEPLPDFIDNRGTTYDLKVNNYHMSAAHRFAKKSSYHNADGVLAFSIQDYQQYGTSGFYTLMKHDNYESYELLPKSLRLSILAESFIKINEMFKN